MIISSEIENLFYKIQHHFLKKKKQEYKLGIELGIKRNFLNMMLKKIFVRMKLLHKLGTKQCIF